MANNMMSRIENILKGKDTEKSLSRIEELLKDLTVGGGGSEEGILKIKEELREIRLAIAELSISVNKLEVHAITDEGYGNG